MFIIFNNPQIYYYVSAKFSDKISLSTSYNVADSKNQLSVEVPDVGTSAIDTCVIGSSI